MVSVGRRYATVHAGTTASQQLAAIASPNGSTVRRGLANIAPGRRNDVPDSTHHTPTPRSHGRIARVSFAPIHPYGDPR